MKTILKIATAIAAIVVVFSAAYYLGKAGQRVTGGSSATNMQNCTYSSVNVSTTRQRAVDAFGGRQRIRLENLSPSSNDVYYSLTNTSTTVSTSTGERLQAGEYVELTREFGDLWPGQIWLLANTSTAQGVSIAECY